MDYQHPTVEKLVLNRHFQQWVKHSDKELDLFWSQWIGADPNKKALVEQARKIILSMEFPDDLKEADISHEWSKIELLLDRSQPKKQTKEPKRIAFPVYWRVAAAVILLLVCGILFYQINNKSVTTTVLVTRYGETKEVTLPDGSVVVLNANSKLRYKAPWKQHKSREVWLEGEAFFSVVHQSNDQKFLVRTTDSSQVEVLGTTFTVHKRQKNTRVVLNSGKVQMQKLYKGHISQVMMQPGELAQWSPSKRNIVKKRVNTRSFIAFKDGKFIFDNTPLKAIVDQLRDTHGLHLRVLNPELLDKEFTGTFPLDNIELLLQALSRTYDLNIRKEGNQLLLQSRSSDPN